MVVAVGLASAVPSVLIELLSDADIGDADETFVVCWSWLEEVLQASVCVGYRVNVREAYSLPSWRLLLRALSCDSFECFRPHGLCGESVERFRLHASGGTKKLPLQIGFCVT